jgi:DNA-binding NtrC family response regulator
LPRILVVDDEAAIRSLLATALERAGYEVYTAPDGSEAAALCAHESFDAIVSDVVMPNMNGHDLARWIAERNPNTRMVLMSGYDMGCHNCPYSPRCRFLAKPFRLSQVLSAVSSVLEQPSAN